MVSRRTDRLLHKLTHHTNIEQPYSKYISGRKYPAQDIVMLGSIVRLRYKNRYIPDVVYHDGYEQYTDNNIYRGSFKVLRFDIEEPFKMIAVKDDYSIMITADSRTYEDVVHIYSKQIEPYLGLYMHDQYFDTPDVIIKAVLLRCDCTEPLNDIIAELYLNNTVRFVTGEEVQSIVMDRYDIDGVRDYNAMDPEEHSFVYVDLNGKFATSEGESITVDADGGYPDPLADMYRRDILSFDELYDLRERIITERDLYDGSADE